MFWRVSIIALFCYMPDYSRYFQMPARTPALPGIFSDAGEDAGAPSQDFLIAADFKLVEY